MTVPMKELAEMYLTLGRYAEADAIIIETISLHEQLLGSPSLPPQQADSTFSTLISLRDELSTLYMVQGKWVQADELLTSVLNEFEKSLPSSERGSLHPILRKLVGIVLNRGHFGRAASLAETLANLPVRPGTRNF